MDDKMRTMTRGGMNTKHKRDPVLLVGDTGRYPDMRYATGFCAPDPVILLAQGQKKTLVVSAMEKKRASKESHSGIEVLSYEELGTEQRRSDGIGAVAALLLTRKAIRRVLVPADFPAGVVETLRNRRIRVRIARTALFPQRSVKSPREIRAIRETQRATVCAMGAAISEIARSRTDSAGRLRIGRQLVTSEYIIAIIEEELLRHKCFSETTIVACGKAASLPHGAGKGPLSCGEPIVIDIFPRNTVHGYWGDLTRTVVKGKAAAELTKMYAAVKSAHGKALACVKAGVGTRRVHQAAAAELARRGFKTEQRDGNAEGFIHGVGHGVGLEIHEQPVLSRRSKGKLQAGQVITIEPGLYYAHIGGIRLEDTVVVTRSGYRHLARFPKTFSV